jgi:hypothetical protein
MFTEKYIQRRRSCSPAFIVKIACYGLVATIANFLIAGCDSGPANRPIHVIADFDTSGGFRPHLGQSALLLCRVIDQLDSTDKLDCYRTDNLTAPFYQGQMPDSAEAFQPVLVKELSGPAHGPGTYPAAFFRQIESDIVRSPEPTVVIVFSDADNDDPSRYSRQAIADAGRRIAKNPLVVVCFCGASRENWTSLERSFRPLSSRLHLCTASEMSLDEIMQAVGQARQLSLTPEKGAVKK